MRDRGKNDRKEKQIDSRKNINVGLDQIKM